MFARARSEEDGPLNAVPLVGGVPSPSSALRAHRLRTIGLAGALLAVALVALAAANMPHAARGGAPARVQTQRHAASSYAVAPSVLPELDSYGFPVLTDVLPKDGSRVVWGICGPGRIAGDFTAALSAMGAKIGAVGAGSLPNALDRATDFARLFRIPRAYGSYEELARDSSVQAVYIVRAPVERTRACPTARERRPAERADAARAPRVLTRARAPYRRRQTMRTLPTRG